MKLFIVDFDQTLISKHSFDLITDAIAAERKMFGVSKIEADVELQWELIKDIKPIGGVMAWQKLFAKMIAAHDVVAIATYNPYTYLIQRYLTEMLKLPQEMIDNIRIKNMPANKINITDGKNLLIKDLMAPYSNSLLDVILIDDDEDIIKVAKDEGYFVIRAASDGLHLKAAEHAINRELSVKKLDLSGEFTKRWYEAIRIYFVKEVSEIIDRLELLNSYLITMHYELFFIESNGEMNKIIADSELIKNIVLSIPIDRHRLDSEKQILVSHLLNTENERIFNRLLAPDYYPDTAMTEIQNSQPTTIPANKLIFREKLKTCEIADVLLTDDFREIILNFERLFKTHRGRFVFMLNGQEINLSDHYDKPFSQFLSTIYSDQPIPAVVTIDLVRKSGGLFSTNRAVNVKEEPREAESKAGFSPN